MYRPFLIASDLWTDIQPAELKRIHRAVWANLERIRYLYKGEAYSYERECRLVKSAIDVNLGNEVAFEPEEQPDSSFRIRHYYENEDLRIDRILTTGSLYHLRPPCVAPRQRQPIYTESIEQSRIGRT